MLKTSPYAKHIAQVWQKREKTEQEASSLFAHLAVMLNHLELAAPLVKLAARAAEEEAEHAWDCRRIINATGIKLERLSPAPVPFLGPKKLSANQKALYTSVAMGCITETLSAALLLEMKQCTEHPLIREIVHKILADEIGHSRLGWEHLKQAASQSDVSWLGDYLPKMLDEVLAEETLTSRSATSNPDLSEFGILPRPRVEEIFRETIASVLIPGFTTYGVGVGATRKWAGEALAA